MGTVTLQVAGRSICLPVRQMIAFHPNSLYQQALCSIAGEDVALTFSQPASAISITAAPPTFDHFALNRPLPLMGEGSNQIMVKGSGKYMVNGGSLKLSAIRPADGKSGYGLCSGELTLVLSTANGALRMPAKLESAFTMGNTVQPAAGTH